MVHGCVILSPECMHTSELAADKAQPHRVRGQTDLCFSSKKTKLFTRILCTVLLIVLRKVAGEIDSNVMGIARIPDFALGPLSLTSTSYLASARSRTTSSAAPTPPKPPPPPESPWWWNTLHTTPNWSRFRILVFLLSPYVRNQLGMFRLKFYNF